MQAGGFAPEDYDSGPVEIWPENWPAWHLFLQVSTQWRTGMAGPAGLDYGPLFTLMAHQGLQGQDWQQAFDDIRTIELAALEQMRDNTHD